MKQRIFIGTYPAGIVFADTQREKKGDYARLAFLPFDTLKLELQDDCPIDLEQEIRRAASAIQCQVGQQYPTSATGQTVMLGAKVRPVKMTIRGQSASEVHEIIAFSMREPSRMACRFKTKDLRFLSSDGCVLSFEGDVDALPPAMT